ncbi:MAG: endolytic transglycosylase MltG [Chitinophagaceae bacterium]|nr:MAG: endolytic transglycosylase MltG [Chitinophagaceae bacterium]
MEKKTKKKGCVLKVLGVVVLIGILVSGLLGYFIYAYVFSPNVNDETATHELFIPTGASYDEVVEMLDRKNVLLNIKSFEWTADKMNYPNRVKAGRYLIDAGMSNRELIRKLRAGDQQPVMLVLNNMRTKEDLAGKVAGQIEADSLEILTIIKDEEFLSSYGLNKFNVLSIMLPNTYEFFWNTSAKGFFDRMLREFNQFWTEERISKAGNLGLTKYEVVTLASIVEEESNRVDERPRIAGVYLNRLNRGWKLQADPTVKYAIGDFSIRRVLFRHLEYDSPYNTYMYEGLPPGPICLPSLNSIDAVLNPEKHEFMFFSAKEDFSGYHNFARTHREHQANARRFHQELNRRNIYR